jgi:hypothetical protein
MKIERQNHEPLDDRQVVGRKVAETKEDRMSKPRAA